MEEWLGENVIFGIIIDSVLELYSIWKYSIICILNLFMSW